MKFKIAVVQFKVNEFSEEENMLGARKFLKLASKKEANIIIFPEDFVSRTTSDRLESKNVSRNVREFQKLAKEFKIDIIPGSFIEKENSKKYNITYYISSSGKILSRYKKIHLWNSERKNMKPGRDISVFETKYGKFGLVICWDIMFPEIFTRMVKEGVKGVFCPSYWCYEDAGKGLNYDKNSEVKLVDSLCVERAFENEIIFVFCNASGKI